MTSRPVIFDLDGWMVDQEPLYHRSFDLILTRCGLWHPAGEEEYGRVFVGVDAEEAWFTSRLSVAGENRRHQRRVRSRLR